MTYTYPKSIEEAAKLLDSMSLHWEKKIDLNKLNMGIGYECILGQIYGNWTDGMNLLFGSLMNKHLDGVFGAYADINRWTEEVQKRTKIGNNWDWAMLRIREGKKVRRENWDIRVYLTTKVNDRIFVVWHTGLEYWLNFDNVDATDWQLFEERPTLGSIKQGQKFKFKQVHEDGNLYTSKVYQKITRLAGYGPNWQTFIDIETGNTHNEKFEKEEVICLPNS